MTERSIDELLAGLPGPVRPDPSFEAGLRAHLAAELRGDTGVAPPRFTNRPMVTEVIELQTLTPPTNFARPDAVPRLLVEGRRRSSWSPAASWPRRSRCCGTTRPRASRPTRRTSCRPSQPTTTLPGDHSRDHAPGDHGPTAHAGADTQHLRRRDRRDLHDRSRPQPVLRRPPDGEPWVSTLAGEMVRLDPATGEIVAQATVSESSPIAVDADALWVADALTRRRRPDRSRRRVGGRDDSDRRRDPAQLGPLPDARRPGAVVRRDRRDRLRRRRPCGSAIGLAACCASTPRPTRSPARSTCRSARITSVSTATTCSSRTCGVARSRSSTPRAACRFKRSRVSTTSPGRSSTAAPCTSRTPPTAR